MSAQGRQSTGSSSSSSLQRCGSQASQDQPQYWTDDLPVCQLSGVGFSTNQIYRKDGVRVEEHPFEDRSFHFRQDGSVYLYGVLDGHDGSRVSSFSAQRMPAELLLDQLNGCHSDDEVKRILLQAFESVEKGFLDSIDDALANLLLESPEGTTVYDTYFQHPESSYKPQSQTEAEIIGGTTAVVALIINDKLFIANAGCCRALLCKTDPSGVLRVIQLTSDHDLDNESEQLRLAALGLDVERLKQVGHIGRYRYTRSIGDYAIKDGYRRIELLRDAGTAPLIAEPELRGGIHLDDSGSFLLLMSAGLCRSLSQASAREPHINRDIAGLVASQFAVQSTLHGVAQAVVDQVVRLHHDTFTMGTEACQKRDDITLLVRNFGYPLPNAMSSPTPVIAPLSVIIPSGEPPQSEPPELMCAPPPVVTSNQAALSLSWTDTTSGESYTKSTGSSSGGDGGDGGGGGDGARRMNDFSALSLTENNMVDAYVKFDEFYAAMAALSDSEREALEAELQVRPEYEVIHEDHELTPLSSPS